MHYLEGALRAGRRICGHFLISKLILLSFPSVQDGVLSEHPATTDMGAIGREGKLQECSSAPNGRQICGQAILSMLKCLLFTQHFDAVL